MPQAYDPPMPDITQARAQVHRLYSLTDQLKVQLQVLEESRPAVRVEIRSPDADASYDSLVFTVSVEARRSAQDDLRAMKEQLDAISAQKRKVRSAFKQRPERGFDLDAFCQLMVTLTKAQLEHEFECIQHDLDSMSEMGEMESLRLQMAMDRMSKMMSTLSNIMKKIADTNSQIVQNLK
jgi:ABC-type phosphate transport system auxiliary subunit